MEDVKIFRQRDIESSLLPASGEDAGIIRRIIYPPHVLTKGIFMGIAEVNPGYSPHRWHTHSTYKSEGYKVVYPENFEEVFYIVSGSGVMQWKNQDGRIRDEKVNAGDTIFFPVGVAEHQIFNNSNEKIVIVLCGFPTIKVTVK